MEIRVYLCIWCYHGYNGRDFKSRARDISRKKKCVSMAKLFTFRLAKTVIFISFNLVTDC